MKTYLLPAITAFSLTWASAAFAEIITLKCLGVDDDPRRDDTVVLDTVKRSVKLIVYGTVRHEVTALLWNEEYIGWASNEQWEGADYIASYLLERSSKRLQQGLISELLFDNELRAGFDWAGEIEFVICHEIGF
ncbi:MULTISPECIES: hypothetical protein [Rhodobacterales]|uniref:hypothetical protein n=1 Tax=Rhodobacterales TaxID=204455 RepID=UPI0032991E1C